MYKNFNKHKDFKIVNSQNDNSKFSLRLFNFELYNDNHHSTEDLKNNKLFILDLNFNSIKDIYNCIKSFKNINDLKNYYYNEWFFKKFNYHQEDYLHYIKG